MVLVDYLGYMVERLRLDFKFEHTFVLALDRDCAGVVPVWFGSYFCDIAVRDLVPGVVGTSVGLEK